MHWRQLLTFSIAPPLLCLIKDWLEPLINNNLLVFLSRGSKTRISFKSSKTRVRHSGKINKLQSQGSMTKLGSYKWGNLFLDEHNDQQPPGHHRYAQRQMSDGFDEMHFILRLCFQHHALQKALVSTLALSLPFT